MFGKEFASGDAVLLASSGHPSRALRLGLHRPPDEQRVRVLYESDGLPFKYRPDAREVRTKAFARGFVLSVVCAERDDRLAAVDELRGHGGEAFPLRVA